MTKHILNTSEPLEPMSGGVFCISMFRFLLYLRRDPLSFANTSCEQSRAEGICSACEKPRKTGQWDL